jgi:hypothetical protein
MRATNGALLARLPGGSGMPDCRGLDSAISHSTANSDFQQEIVAPWMGDMIAGVAAPLLAWAMLRLGVRPLLLWNAFGAADLVNAVALGALSATGPLQVFAGPPTSAMTTSLPWLIIPGFLVPALSFVHIVIFYRLLARAGALTIVGEGRRQTAPRLSPGAVLFGSFRSERRRATLPVGAPPPVPQARGYCGDHALGNGTAT